MEVIQTESLIKNFRTVTALDNISIRVYTGEIYGFLGLNGAGKTTLIRLLLGMIRPDKGSILLFGKSLTHDFNLWNQIGYMVESPHSYPNLSVRDNLKVFYQLRQLNNPILIDQIIDQLKLTPYKNSKAEVLSLGNAQRLGLAKALMHQPKLLLLDEPINGLDPQGIVEIRELLQKLALQGTTVFLSSHLLGEVSKLTTRIGILHQGKLIKELTSNALSEQLIKKLIINTLDNTKAIDYLINAHYKVRSTEDRIEIYTHEAILHPERIVKLLVEANLTPTQVYVYTEDLEDYFLRIIKQSI